MQRAQRSGTAALLLVMAAARAAAEPPGPLPLFASNAVLELRIEAPLEQLMQERPEDDELPGRLSYVNAEGDTVQLDIGLRTRGNSRRRATTCTFAPLRVNLKTGQVEATVFAGQDKLKLVTHCQDRSERYTQAVIAEYLGYRILNVLTDTSYRARLLKIRYADSDDGRAQDNFGFFVETSEQLAARIGAPPLSVAELAVTDLQSRHTNLVSVFQYLIGNTDFSPVAGPPGEDCCHNMSLFGAAAGSYFAVPYDFDQSGLVDAPHAQPNPRFGLRSVRQRLYRGRCANSGNLSATLARFREARDAIDELIAEQQQLSAYSRRKMQRFVNSFYATIDSPKRVDRKLVKACN